MYRPRVRRGRLLAAALVLAWLASACKPEESMIHQRRYAATVVSGELKKWHRVTLTFDGPSTSEGAAKNPFLDYRLDVTFSSGGKTKVVPGFYAADGKAGETSADSGGKWRVHFSPDATGTWTYAASFRTGADVAIDGDPKAGTATGFDGDSGSFTVGPSDKSGRDHRAKGRLDYVGEHYLRFAETGETYLKGGADSPENFLAYFEFDGTPSKHQYQPHAKDYQAGDPTFKGGKGKNIIGALNYLASKGMNSVYFLTMNVGGDGKDVWPWTSNSERLRFDVSKLAQWEVVFSHMDKLGLMLHVITQETENDQLLNGGALGKQRKLYYRELIARFAHHLALVWNLGEENTNTGQQRKDFAKHFKTLDPYQHPVVVHTYPNQYDSVYTPLLGYPHFDGPSLQMGDMTKTHAETQKWIDQSAQAGRKWVACLDEIGPASTGVKADANDFWHDSVRRHALWGNLMAGGAGVEWYFGYQQPHNDLNCEDWRSRDQMWDLTRFALEFFQSHLSFTKMKGDDTLTSANDDYCFAQKGELYAIYLPPGSGGTTDLTLEAGTYTVKWYDPRAGGALQDGTIQTITGPGAQAIGEPPSDKDKDWVVLVRRPGAPDAGPTSDTVATADTGSVADGIGSATDGVGPRTDGPADGDGGIDDLGDDDGCSCSLLVSGAGPRAGGLFLLGLLASIVTARRIRRRAEGRRR